jgi:uncharacterized membrane protein YheB (UPF0754 family)
VASGAVGLFTNWLAVKMILGPQRYVGFGRFDWQGVIPRNTAQKARTLVQTSLQKVLPQQELIDRIDADVLLDVLSHRLDPFLKI